MCWVRLMLIPGAVHWPCELDSSKWRAEPCKTQVSQLSSTLQQTGASIDCVSCIAWAHLHAHNLEYAMWVHSNMGKHIETSIYHSNINFWVSNYSGVLLEIATAKTPCQLYTYKASWQLLGASLAMKVYSRTVSNIKYISVLVQLQHCFEDDSKPSNPSDRSSIHGVLTI